MDEKQPIIITYKQRRGDSHSLRENSIFIKWPRKWGILILLGTFSGVGVEFWTNWNEFLKVVVFLTHASHQYRKPLLTIMTGNSFYLSWTWPELSRSRYSGLYASCLWSLSLTNTMNKLLPFGRWQDLLGDLPKQLWRTRVFQLLIWRCFHPRTSIPVIFIPLNLSKQPPQTLELWGLVTKKNLRCSKNQNLEIKLRNKLIWIMMGCLPSST